MYMSMYTCQASSRSIQAACLHYGIAKWWWVHTVLWSVKVYMYMSWLILSLSLPGSTSWNGVYNVVTYSLFTLSLPAVFFHLVPCLPVGWVLPDYVDAASGVRCGGVDCTLHLCHCHQLHSWRRRCLLYPYTLAMSSLYIHVHVHVLCTCFSCTCYTNRQAHRQFQYRLWYITTSFFLYVGVNVYIHCIQCVYVWKCVIAWGNYCVVWSTEMFRISTI